MDLYKFDDLIIRQPINEMLDKIRNAGYVQMIIAMKGDAYTGKSTCAHAIAEAYRCTLIKFDDILDSLHPSSSPAPSPEEANHLADVAFEVVLRVVRLQILMERPVVIDSFSESRHLERLLQVTDEFKNLHMGDHMHCRFVIVECRPEAQYAWKLRFEERDRAETDRWYKPKEWSGVVFTESVADYPPGKLPDYVCRLIVDTTEYVNPSYLGAATLDLCYCSKGHLIGLRDWLPTKPVHGGFPALSLMAKYSGRTQIEQVHETDPTTPDGEATPSTTYSCRDGRHLLQRLTTSAPLLAEYRGRYDELPPAGRCEACLTLILHPVAAYACSRCSLPLHKSCAELEERSVIDHPTLQLPSFLRIISRPVSEQQYSSMIPQEHKQCCRSRHNEFSVNCESCLWVTHLRSRLVPTLLAHDGHGEGYCLCFWIASAGRAREYKCAACKLPGFNVGYTCLRGPFKYNVHVECALLPRSMRHIHGGHDHRMRLGFSTEQVTDDYFCDVCLDPRDPKGWHYSCEADGCSFVSHLGCVYDDQC